MNVYTFDYTIKRNIMTTTAAAKFVFETIQTAKWSLMVSGNYTPTGILGMCTTLSKTLDLNVSFIMDIMEGEPTEFLSESDLQDRHYIGK